MTPEALNLLARQAFPLLARNLKYAEDHFGAEYSERYAKFVDVIENFTPDEAAWRKKTEALGRYSKEYLVLQADLIKTGAYCNTSYADVEKAVYTSAVMDDYYLDGLMLSQFLWPNHYLILDYILNAIAKLPAADRILDVPGGTGSHTLFMSQIRPETRFHLVDLSPSALKFAQRLHKAGAPNPDLISYQHLSVFDIPETETYPVIFNGELLEHLEDPKALLDKLYRLLDDDGTLVLTTAIFAAAVDHLYLFLDAHEVRAMLEERFIVEDELILPVSLKPYDPSMKKEAMNYVATLRKR